MAFLNVTLLSLLVVFPRLLLAQMFHGQVGDNRTFNPLPYATFGIKGKPIAGQADRNGIFKIDLSEAMDTDTIQISHWGYTSRSVLKQEIMDAHYDIKLSSTAYQAIEQVTNTKTDPLNDITNQRDYSKSSGGLQELAIETDAVPLELAKSVMRLTIQNFDSLQVSVLTLPMSVHQSVEVSAISESSFFTGDKKQQQNCVTVTPNKLIINPNCKITIEWIEPGISKL